MEFKNLVCYNKINLDQAFINTYKLHGGTDRLLQPTLGDYMMDNISIIRPNHYYNDNTRINPDYADGWFIKKAKVRQNSNARDILLDMKMRTVVLDGQRDCERGLYRPLQTGYKPEGVWSENVEYKTHKPKHQHLYNKYR